jgi:hypothetical protein
MRTFPFSYNLKWQVSRSSLLRSPTVCVKSLRNRRRDQGPTKDCRTTDEPMNKISLSLMMMYRLQDLFIVERYERMVVFC